MLTDAVCEKHGTVMKPFLFGGESGIFCPTCNQEQDAASEREKAEGERKRLLAVRLSGLDIGKRFRGKTFDDYKTSTPEQDRIKRVCQKYAETFAERRAEGDGLILSGKPGTGKNHLAAALAETVTMAGYVALHTTVIKLIRSIKETWGRNSEVSESEMIARFLEPDLLIIDEVGVQFGSQTEQVFLMEIINGRYAEMLPTVLLSNLDVAGLAACLGEQVVDRFYEGKSQVLPMTWESHRKKGVAV